MRKVAVLLMAALMPVAGLTSGAGARPANPHLPGLTPMASDALSDALDEGRISESEYTLHRARSLFRLGAVRREFGAVVRPDPHAATWILRDLALRTSSLSGDEQETAEAILARPDDSSGGGFPGTGWSNSATPGPKKCGTNVCVHWVTNTTDKATEAWATSTLATFEEVWAKEVDAMGFNAPKGDGNEGGDSRLDVYIDNFDGDGLYGYCNTGPFSPPPWDQAVFCSVDNDYANFLSSGSPLTALQLLQATSAHEFFHAVQYSYDAGDDAWIGEATATWIEDEVYDTVNDNRGYVYNSISSPKTSADSWGGEGGAPPGFQYGQWVWMRYLTETHGPDVIKKLWERLDARTGAPDDYSIEGLTSVLGDPAYNTNFGASFASFAATNVKPSAFYSEAAEDPAFYAPAPRDATHVLGAAATGTVSNVRHLSSRYITLRPASGTAATDQLTVRVNMTDTVAGSRATLVSLPKTGAAPVFTVIDLDSTGAGSQTVSFGDTTEVVLVLTNASNRYTGCHKNEQTTRTCNGRAQDDDQGYGYSAAIGTTAPEPPDGSGPGPTEGPGVQNLKAVPSVFSPNGDGRKDKTKISFELIDDASVTIGLYKRSTVIGYFAQGQDLEGGFRYGPIPWNGKAPNGKLVKSGDYKVRLTAIGDTGTTVKTITVTVKR